MGGEICCQLWCVYYSNWFTLPGWVARLNWVIIVGVRLQSFLFQSNKPMREESLGNFAVWRGETKPQRRWREDWIFLASSWSRQKTSPRLRLIYFVWLNGVFNLFMRSLWEFSETSCSHQKVCCSIQIGSKPAKSATIVVHLCQFFAEKVRLRLMPWWLTMRRFFWVSTISSKSTMSWLRSNTCPRSWRFASRSRFSWSSFWMFWEKWIAH